MAFGLTAQGFNKKQITDIKSELEQAFRDAFGAGIKTTPDTIFGKMIGITAEREGTIWDLAEAIYNASYPNSASDVSLARVGEITGVAPNAATRSTVVVYLAGTDTSVIPEGSIIATQDAGDQFQLTADVTLVGSNQAVVGITRVGAVATANVVAHGKIEGDWVFINSADQDEYNGLHQITNIVDPDNFDYAVSGSPTTPATGTIDADPATAGDAEGVDTGPIQALSGTLNVIITPVPGWTRVENALDATKGTNAETDAAFRTRRLLALLGSGSATIEAIRGALLVLTDVTQAIVFENVTDFTDVDGRPPHSIEALVKGGADSEILDEIFAKTSGGIETHGTTSGTVTDSMGNNHTIRFSRPAPVNIWLEVDVTVDANYPADGDDQVEIRLLAFGDALEIGEDVIVFPSLISSFSDVPGILDVAVRIGIAASPTLDDNIIIAPTEIAVFDSSRIIVTQV